MDMAKEIWVTGNGIMIRFITKLNDAPKTAPIIPAVSDLLILVFITC